MVNFAGAANAFEGAVSKGARTEARNLAEKLALDEAKGGAGTQIMKGAIVDDRFPAEWAKMQHMHPNPGGKNIVIYYWQRVEDGLRIGFKVDQRDDARNQHKRDEKAWPARRALGMEIRWCGVGIICWTKHLAHRSPVDQLDLWKLRRREQRGPCVLAAGDEDGAMRLLRVHHADQFVHVVMWDSLDVPVLALDGDIFAIAMKLQVEAPLASTGPNVLHQITLVAGVPGHDVLELAARHARRRVVTSKEYVLQSPHVPSPRPGPRVLSVGGGWSLAPWFDGCSLRECRACNQENHGPKGLANRVRSHKVAIPGWVHLIMGSAIFKNTVAP
jgi:hypothetical protein